MRKMKKLIMLLAVLTVVGIFEIPMNSYAATSDAKLTLKAPAEITAGSTVNLDVYIDNTTTTTDATGVCVANVSIIYDADQFSIPLGYTSAAVQKGADAPSSWEIEAFEQTPGITTPGYLTLIIGDPIYINAIQTTNAEKHIARLSFTANSDIPPGTYDFKIYQDMIATGLTTPNGNLFGGENGDGEVPANFSVSYTDTTTTVAPASTTVTYDANGGSGTMADSSGIAGSEITLSANAFIRDGYTFSGWATTSNGAVAYANGGSFTIPSGNTTLYAVWTSSSSTTELGFISGSKFWTTTFSDLNFKNAGDTSAEVTYDVIRFGEYVSITAEALKAQIVVTNGSIKIFDGSNADITDSTSAYIGSTCTVTLYDTQNNLVKTYLVILRGDINGDGFILASDVAVLRKFTANTSTFSIAQKYAGDINGDGYVIVADVVSLQKFTVNTGTIDQTLD